MLGISRYNSEIASAAVAVGAGLTGYTLWRVLSGLQAKENVRRRIDKLNQHAQEYRAYLKSCLTGDRLRYRHIADLPFQELKAKLQSGELNAVEVLHAYQFAALEATEKTNCVTQFVRGAEQRAAYLDSLPSNEPKKPLHGIPVSMKETFLLEGTEATCGYGCYIGKFNDCGNGPVVQFLIDQGCVPFVKTNVPQGAISADSRNPVYGLTTHPFDSLRSPGGSSSGEGCLLAANGSILGLGTDVLGSTRVPSAWCGSFTMKPTSQRMISDRGGAEPGSEGTNRILPNEMGAYAFMARDSNTLCTIYRHFYSESTFLNNPDLIPLSFREDVFTSKKPLVIGYYYVLPGTVETVPAMKHGVRMAKEALENCGHKLVEFKPIDPRKAVLLAMEAITADGNVDVKAALAKESELTLSNKRIAASPPKWLRALIGMLFKRVLGTLVVETMFVTTPKTTPHEVNLTLRKLKDYRKKFLNEMKNAGIDVLLGPGFSCPAVHLDDSYNLLGSLAYTCLFNVLNLPAGVLPIGEVSQANQNAMTSYREIGPENVRIKTSLSSHSVGLPIAVQIAGKPYCEETVLRIMQQLDDCFNYGRKMLDKVQL